MDLEFQNATIGSSNITISSLEHHYRALGIFFLNLNFEKIEFQRKSISLISLENWAKCWIVFLKRANVNFVQEIKL